MNGKSGMRNENEQKKNQRKHRERAHETLNQIYSTKCINLMYNESERGADENAAWRRTRRYWLIKQIYYVREAKTWDFLEEKALANMIIQWEFSWKKEMESVLWAGTHFAVNNTSSSWRCGVYMRPRLLIGIVRWQLHGVHVAPGRRACPTLVIISAVVRSWEFYSSCFRFCNQRHVQKHDKSFWRIVRWNFLKSGNETTENLSKQLGFCWTFVPFSIEQNTHSATLFEMKLLIAIRCMCLLSTHTIHVDSTRILKFTLKSNWNERSFSVLW